MTRVIGLVFPAIFSIAVAFAVPPAKNTTVHKTVASSAHTTKATGSSHMGAQQTAVSASKSGSKSPQLRTVSTHSTLKTAHSKSVNAKTVRGRRAVVRSTASTFQVHPDEDRYRQIQQALADKGYFKGEVNGQWGPDSVEALQKFQLDNKLPDIYTDGKINSLSLIGLGLGPKHGAHMDDAVPTPPVPPAPTTLGPAASDNPSVSTPPPQQSN